MLTGWSALARAPRLPALHSVYWKLNLLQRGGVAASCWNIYSGSWLYRGCAPPAERRTIMMLLTPSSAWVCTIRGALFVLVTHRALRFAFDLWHAFEAKSQTFSKNPPDNTCCLQERNAYDVLTADPFHGGSMEGFGAFIGRIFRYWQQAPCVAIKAVQIDLLLVHTLLPSLNDTQSLQLWLVDERKSRMLHMSDSNSKEKTKLCGHIWSIITIHSVKGLLFLQCSYSDTFFS